MDKGTLLGAMAASTLLLIANAQWAFIYSNYDRLKEIEKVRMADAVDVQERFIAGLEARPAPGVARHPVTAEGGESVARHLNPSSISLPFISVTAPVTAAGADPDSQLDAGTVLFWTDPGEDGERSPVVIGHSSAHNKSPYQYVFTQIPKMRRGNVVALESSGSTVTYEYVRGKIVAPGDVDTLRGGKDKAYLVTCYPFLTSLSRYVVELRKVAEYAAEGGG